MAEWLQTDEDEDVAASIRHVLLCRTAALTDPQAWKWVALALHSALQGACICHVVTTATPLGAVTKLNAVAWIAYFESVGTDTAPQPPRTYLLSLPELLRRVRRPRSAGDRSNASGVAISDVELEWLCRFHDDIRNQFTHFEPRGWSIEISGLAPLAHLVARIIDEIIDFAWAFRHKDTQWKGRLREDLRALSALQQHGGL